MKIFFRINILMIAAMLIWGLMYLNQIPSEVAMFRDADKVQSLFISKYLAILILPALSLIAMLWARSDSAFEKRNIPASVWVTELTLPFLVTLFTFIVGVYQYLVIAFSTDGNSEFHILPLKIARPALMFGLLYWTARQQLEKQRLKQA